MPKKGKKKGKGKKPKKQEESAEEITALQDEPVIDKEQLLKDELEKVTKDVENAKKRVSGLKIENEWLQEEAQKIRTESHEYMGFMEKRLDKRQKALVTLHDNNEHEIKELLSQREHMLEAYKEQKDALRAELLTKENELSRAKQDREELLEFKKLKDEQADIIKHLEKEAQNLRIQHSEQLQLLKAQFIKEKRAFETESEEKIQKLSRESYREAIMTLVGQSNSTKTENRTLRKELTYLIHQTKVLQDHKKKLQEQQQELLREKEFASDIRALRNVTAQKFQKVQEVKE